MIYRTDQRQAKHGLVVSHGLLYQFGMSTHQSSVSPAYFYWMTLLKGLRFPHQRHGLCDKSWENLTETEGTFEFPEPCHLGTIDIPLVSVVTLDIPLSPW